MPHGGVLSTILDQIMGKLVVVHEPKDFDHVAANLNVGYVKSISEPGVVMVRARLQHAEGRKVTVTGELIGVPYGSSDSVEITCTGGRALFIRLSKSGATRFRTSITLRLRMTIPLVSMDCKKTISDQA